MIGDADVGELGELVGAEGLEFKADCVDGV